jgi:hypothetical protein
MFQSLRNLCDSVINPLNEEQDAILILPPANPSSPHTLRGAEVSLPTLFQEVSTSSIGLTVPYFKPFSAFQILPQVLLR